MKHKKVNIKKEIYISKITGYLYTGIGLFFIFLVGFSNVEINIKLIIMTFAFINLFFGASELNYSKMLRILTERSK